MKNTIIQYTQNQDILKKYRAIWGKIKRKPSEDYLKIYSSINGILSPEYVPENIYYYDIELKLNNRLFSISYADKNFYELYFSGHINLFPEAIIRGIDGVLLDKEYRKISINEAINVISLTDSDLIIKPSVDTAGGDKVELIRKENINVNLLNRFISLFNGNFIFQKRIKPHAWFENFNKTSLNTVRVFTYRSVQDNNVYALSSVLRYGKPGSIVDNQAAGGMTIGINKEGKISTFSVNKYGEKHIPEILNELDTEYVPYYNDMINLTKNIASNLYHHRLLAFDLAVNSENQIKILEINFKNIETNFLQMNNGPLFGKYTSEIIEYISNKNKYIVFKFKL